MSTRLLAQSQFVKNTADRVLRKTKLIERLAMLGTVYFTGSYYADLMLAPDIDIHVAVPRLTKEKAIRAFTNFIRKDTFRSHTFHDFIARPRKGFPHGYYLGFKINGDDMDWKIDVWLFEPSLLNMARFKRQQKVMDLVKNADEKTRNKILVLKEKRLRGKLKKTGLEIYEEVLELKK